MATKIKFTRKDKFLDQETFLSLIDDFINDSYAGRRTKKNGARLKESSIRNYFTLKKYLVEYTQQNTFQLKIYIVNNLSQREKEEAKRYYKKFYASFTDFLYDNKKVFDNYVGFLMKMLRSLFNYFEEERNISVGTFHKSFFIPKEEIPIVALDAKQLNYMIYDKGFTEKVRKNNLEEIKDVFVFGCTVALRVSDLSALSRENLIIKGNKYYIQIKSQKTKIFTSIQLPDYAVEIINKYYGKQDRLLPILNTNWVNKNLKRLSVLIPDDFEMIKTRERRGEQVIIYKDPINKIHYKLSDHISSHTMRRTAITTMLSLGMPEHIVRKISGHAANSTEFYKYVRLSQSVIDEQTDMVFKRLKSVRRKKN